MMHVAYLHGCEMVIFSRLTDLCEDLAGPNIHWRPIRDIATYEIAPEPPCNVHNTEAATCRVYHEITRFGHGPDQS